MDIEKAFDSLDNDFLVHVLNKFGFGINFISWIKLLLNSQQSCVINGGNTIPYFNLEEGTRQGDPVSAYLFIVTIEVFFVFIKSNENIKVIEIFKYVFSYTTYADDSTFFLRDILSVRELINSFNQFYHFSGLKANIEKCGIACIGSLKGVTEEVRGLKCVDLSNNTIKILGIHLSYNKKIQMLNNFTTTIKEIQQVLCLCNSRTLTLRTMIFKTLAISNIVYLVLITNVPKLIVQELQKCKIFSWQKSSPKIKHETLSNTFETGGLKNVDIDLKVISLQCSWVKKLYDENFHEWKIIPLHLIRITLGQNFKFHSNLSYDTKLLTSFPVFYKNIFRYWSQHFTVSPELPSCILSTFYGMIKIS